MIFLYVIFTELNEYAKINLKWLVNAKFNDYSPAS